MTKIVNSAAGNSFFDINGNAIDNSSYKPNVKSGASLGLGTNSEKLDNVPFQFVDGTGTTVNTNQQIVQVDVQEVFTNTKKDYQRTALRTVKSASAIRDNRWNSYSGTWDSSYPQTANDTSATSLTSDNSSNKTTRVTYQDGIIPDTDVKNS